MGYPTGSRDSKRWLIAQNKSGEVIPPYGCVQIKGYGEDGCFGALSRDNEIYWAVEKISQLMEEHQNPACLFFNGETEIQDDGFGSVTRDWPATALHDGTEDSLAPGQPCGPKEGKFWLSSEGHALTCMGHDKSDPKESQGNMAGEHTIIVTGEPVSPAPVHVCHGGSGGVASRTLTAGEPFILSMDDQEWAQFDNDNNFEVVDDEGDEHYKMLKPGTFLASLSASITADYNSVSAGTELRIELIQKREGAPISTLGIMRELDIDQYETGGSFPLTLQKNRATYENVAMSHPLHVMKDDIIVLKNASSCDVMAKQILFSLLLLNRQGFTPRDDDPSPP